MSSKLVTSLPIVFVKQGECHFSRHPELVITILGSCLSVIMYNIEHRFSALTHCLMPSQHMYNDDDGNDYKYVDTSVKQMLAIFDKQKIPRHKISIKIFGGAEQLSNDKKRTQPVGKQNIIMALNILDKEGLNVISMDVGGTKGRKIYFSSHTGEVLLSRLEGYKIVRLDKIK
jgi:chemotaxis protein CheD